MRLRSNPYVNQCELTYKQTLLVYNFHVGVGVKRRGINIVFALESTGFEYHTDIYLSKFYFVLFMKYILVIIKSYLI